MKEAVHRFVFRAQDVDAISTRLIDAPASTIPVAKFVKPKGEKSSLQKGKIEKRFTKLAEAVDEKKRTGSRPHQGHV